jgi:hypothetical protein
MTVALCMGKGNRVVHQIINGIGVIALLISFVAIMIVPSRLYEVCISPILQQNVSGAGTANLSAYPFMSSGGKLLCAVVHLAKISHAIMVTPCAAALLLCALIVQFLNIYTIHKLLDSSVSPASVVDINNSLRISLLSPEQHAVCSDDMMLPPGWVKLHDDHVTYYANADLRAFQCTHPSLNAPPFQLDKTDYVTGLPAIDAPAWRWMKYLWWREVKSTHSVIGTLCALSSRFGCKCLSPPRDVVFQSRLWFRMLHTLSSWASSFCVHTVTFIALGFRANPNQTATMGPEDAYAATEHSPHMSWIPYAAQLLGQSIPFSIYRYM